MPYLKNNLANKKNLNEKSTQFSINSSDSNIFNFNNKPKKLIKK